MFLRFDGKVFLAARGLTGMKSLWMVSVLLVSLLAGCSSSGDSPSTSLDFSDKGLQATSTTGVIRGVVVDLAIAPIAKANVTLIGKARSTLADDTGRFGFDNLEPGTYFLKASKRGFSGTQQSVEVVAGVSEPPILKVQMERDPTSAPYVVPTHFRGFISCSFKAANFVFDASSCDPTGLAGYSGRDASSPVFEATRAPTYYQSEMTWESNQPIGDQLVTIQWACKKTDSCQSDDTYRLCNVRGPAPLTCRVNATTGGGGGGVGIKEAQLGTNNTAFMVSMFSNCSPCYRDTGAPDPLGIGILGVGVVTEQTFDVYNHLFYNYSPPADWTFLATGKVPPPPT